MTNITNVANQFSEDDWKLFRKKIILWQENYMDRLNEEYIHILKQGRNPSEIFWELQKRINKDRRKPGVMLEMKRSSMILNILNLLNDGVIGMDDLNDFSDIFKETIQRMSKP